MEIGFYQHHFLVFLKTIILMKIFKFKLWILILNGNPCISDRHFLPDRSLQFAVVEKTPSKKKKIKKINNPSFTDAIDKKGNAKTLKKSTQFSKIVKHKNSKLFKPVRSVMNLMKKIFQTHKCTLVIRLDQHRLKLFHFVKLNQTLLIKNEQCLLV